MKKIFFTLFAGLATFISLEAQVKEETLMMSAGPQPALTIVLEGADLKFAELEWKDYTKSYGKATKVKGSKESVIMGIHINEIGSGNLLNAYSLAEEVAGGTKMILWIDMGTSFLKSSDKEYVTAEKFMENFAHKVKVDIVALDLENQQKRLIKFQADSSKLVRENVSLHKTIDDAKLKIEQAEIDIPANLAAQETAKGEVDNQKTMVESVKDSPDELKDQQKLLTKLESNVTKLQRENESLHKVVTDANAKIKKAELDIKANLEEQESTKTIIKNQKTVVATVQKKLDELKSQKPK